MQLIRNSEDGWVNVDFWRIICEFRMVTEDMLSGLAISCGLNGPQDRLDW